MLSQTESAPVRYPKAEPIDFHLRTFFNWTVGPVLGFDPEVQAYFAKLSHAAASFHNNVTLERPYYL